MAKNYWVFRLDRLDRTSLEGIKNSKKLSFTSGYNFHSEKGDEFLILQPLNPSDKSSWEFILHGSISSFDRVFDPGSNRSKFHVNLRNIDNLQTTNLEDFAFSLARITRFSQPIYHFSRAYSRLSKLEFKSISDGQIFVSRTIFGKVINNLHKTHRLAFIQYFIEKDPDTYFKNRNYHQAFKLLNQYVKNRILIPANYIHQSFGMLEGLVALPIAQTIGFEGSKGEDFLITKVDEFRAISAIERNIGNDFRQGFEEQGVSENPPEYSKIYGVKTMDNLSNAISSVGSNENQFNKLFKNQPWPIQL
ncbi:MAG: hypothetical protein ACI923_001609 [Flavobacteriales bacterium]|jgi:hypothetical protein